MKNKISLNIFTICFIFLNINGIAQETTKVDNMYKKELENHTWKTDKTVLLGSAKEYVLTKFIKRKFAGNLLSFNNQNNVFNSGYKSWCGNDKRISSLKGIYKFEDKDRISFILKTISFNRKIKDESKSHEEIVGKKILFQIIKKDEKFILKRTEK